MIAFTKGSLDYIGSDFVFVDVGGVGFKVFTPINEPLLRIGLGGEVKLYTYLSVREDALVLFGFLDMESLEMFELLIGVTGVGPKSALGMLSAMSVSELSKAIYLDDKKALTKIPGIGAKTAARIVLDLKDKLNLSSDVGTEMQEFTKVTMEVSQGPAQEAVMALMSLGYSETEAKRAVNKTKADGLSVEDIIRRSLKELY